MTKHKNHSPNLEKAKHTRDDSLDTSSDTTQQLKDERDLELAHLLPTANKRQRYFYQKGINEGKAQALEDELEFIMTIYEFGFCNVCDDVYKRLVNERITEIKKQLEELK